MIEESLPDGDNFDYWGLGLLTLCLVGFLAVLGYEVVRWLNQFPLETIGLYIVLAIAGIIGTLIGPWITGKAVVKAERTVKYFR